MIKMAQIDVGIDAHLCHRSVSRCNKSHLRSDIGHHARLPDILSPAAVGINIQIIGKKPYPKLLKNSDLPSKHYRNGGNRD